MADRMSAAHGAELTQPTRSRRAYAALAFAGVNRPRRGLLTVGLPRFAGVDSWPVGDGARGVMSQAIQFLTLFLFVAATSSTFRRFG
jgi:hypothetical protein